MKTTPMSRGLARWVVLAIAGIALLGAATLAGAQTMIHVIGSRFPAIEYYVKTMGQAPGVKAEGTLLAGDKFVEVSALSLSTGSSSYDVIMGNETFMQYFASKGWLEPLDAYLAKHNAQYHFEDFPPNLLNFVRYEGKLYALPFVTNPTFFFYRKDLLEAKGIKPPETFAEYLQAAKALTTKDMFGTTMTLKRVDQNLSEFHWYLNGHGGKWFDAKWKPAFNSAEGVKALEAMKEMMKYAPPGVTAYTNDESAVALQQGVVAMGMQWASRASDMDNPKLSKVVGKINFSSPPSIRKGVPAGSRVSISCFGISKFSKDKENVFRAVAYASSRENMRGGAQLGLPPRVPLMSEPDLVKKNRHWPAGLTAMQEGQPYPMLSEFRDIGEGVTLKIQQALAGELNPKTALDQAVKETEELLRSRGYYK